jgi:acyl-[acyl-carrier-protein]-phospholipid O-acyltransferase/long-chain-fatty-acid--[acyl-carrier-protein] ligase
MWGIEFINYRAYGGYGTVIPVNSLGHHALRAVLRAVLRLWFRFRAYNPAVLETRGPVLLVPNHVSWIDWLFLYVLLDRDWKFVATTTTANLSWVHRKIVTGSRTFPIDPGSAYAVRTMAEYLERGGRLVLFAEGRISTTGALMKLFDGTGFLIRRTNAKVITCYLRGANRVPWVRHTGWRAWFPRVSAHFSAVLTPPTFQHLAHTEERTRLTRWLRDRMVSQQFEVEHAFGPANVLAAVAETARHLPRKVALEDVSGSKLTYRRLMLATDVLAGALQRALAAVQEADARVSAIDRPAAPILRTPVDGGQSRARVGVLLPNVNGMVVTLLSLWAAGRVPTILNFSSGVATMLGCAQLAGIKEVVTSRTFLERAKLDLTPFAAAGMRLIYLEDVRAELTTWAKVSAWVRHMIRPSRTPHLATREVSLRSQAGRRERESLEGHTVADWSSRQHDETAVVLFTSGSENTPKGVELTHGNLLANIRQALAAMDLTDDDRFLSALPLFHSFGLTAGTLLPLVRGCATFLYPSPLHYRVIPTLIYDRNCTVLLATNTFLNGYARKAQPYDFRTLRYLIAGAEKVQADTLETWSRKFGVRVLEGYGATECSPVISVNTWVEASVGSAGRFLPGIEWRIEPVEGVPDGGRLLVRGPNVMKGYLNADADARFKALGGWYDTGDIAEVDAHGFLHLRGRLKRFAKVSGEMVSLTAIEDALAGAFARYGARTEVAILSRPDAEKGEALVAVTNEPRVQLPAIRALLREKGFPNLAGPRELHVVGSIPKLGTGKVNHRALSAALGAG